MRGSTGLLVRRKARRRRARRRSAQLFERLAVVDRLAVVVDRVADDDGERLAVVDRLAEDEGLVAVVRVDDERRPLLVRGRGDALEPPVDEERRRLAEPPPARAGWPGRRVLIRLRCPCWRRRPIHR